MPRYRLAQRRRSLGLSQDRLARMLGTHQTTISQVERGHRGDRQVLNRLRCKLAELEGQRRRIRREERRIAQQRALWDALPSGAAKWALEAAMLERAAELLEVGQPEAADAIQEWIPEAKARAVLDEWFETELAAIEASRVA